MTSSTGDLKSINITLPTDMEGGGGQESVTYHHGAMYSPPPPDVETLNNATVLSGSQNNLFNNGANTSQLTLTNVGALRKVPNDNSPNINQRRATISLTHLPKRPPVDIEFIDLSYSVSEGRKRGYKTILKCINGTFKSGEMTAIMGPSGAGKSTLMNILAGYKTSNLDGTVQINGKERSLRRFRKMSCYIMQDDCLSPHLSVREALNVSANLKLGPAIDRKQKTIIINEIIETMGLQECSDTLAASLSGGQRKRLSIALELVNNPPVMFFDEPTSGLDSSSCFQCITLLKSLTSGGRTVICTIHQPSARLFEMFDYLYMLAEGQCIYRGAVKGLVPFLADMALHCPSYHNPADYVMEVGCNEHGDYLQKLVVAVNAGRCDGNRINTKEDIPNNVVKGNIVGDQSNGLTTSAVTCTTSLLDSSENLPNDGKGAFSTSGLTQFWILLKRTIYVILRDKTLTRMRLLAHFVIGILLGLIYYDIGNDASKIESNVGCLFFITMFTMFTAMMPTILTFPTEMSVFIREHLNYWYSLKAYYFAKTIADIPFQIALTACYVMGVYYLTSQPLEPSRFGMFLLISVLTALVAQSFGLLVGAAFNMEAGTFLGPISTIPMVLFSGFFAKLGDIPVYLRWLPHVSYVKYSFEGVMIAIYGLKRKRLDCNAMYCHFKYPEKFLEHLQMEKDMWSFGKDVLVLCGLFVLLRIAAYFMLRIKLLQNR